jgi:hypothetical protein
MEWWDEEELPPVPGEKLSWTQKFCSHQWKETELIVSKVRDCVKCGAKKEDVDEWEGLR